MQIFFMVIHTKFYIFVLSKTYNAKNLLSFSALIGQLLFINWKEGGRMWGLQVKKKSSCSPDDAANRSLVACASLLLVFG